MVSGACGGQKRVLDPLEHELQMLWDARLVLGTKPESSTNVVETLNH